MKRIWFAATSFTLLAGASGVAFFDSEEAKNLATENDDTDVQETGGYLDIQSGSQQDASDVTIEGVTIWTTEAVRSELGLEEHQTGQQQPAPATAA